VGAPFTFTGQLVELLVEALSDGFIPGVTLTQSPVVFAVPASGVLGDPVFVGLLGQVYQVHGIDGLVYNIISSAHTQVNARFVFLSSGRCPIIDSMAADNCWSHPGSYIGELSFQQRVDGRVHSGIVRSGAASSGFAEVVVDGQQLQVGESVSFGTLLTVTYTSTHAISVHTQHFAFQLHNSDRFINQQLANTVPLQQLRMEGTHGLLGQTHTRTVYANAVKYVEGEVDDYAVAGGDVLGVDFVYNRFVQ